MSPQRTALLTAGLALALALGGLLGFLVGTLVGVSAGSVTAAVVLRSLLTAFILLLVTRLVVRRAYDTPALPLAVAAAGLVGYLLTPATWSGRTLAAQLVLEPGAAAAAVDLVLWVAVVVVAARTVRPRQRVERLPYQQASPPAHQDRTGPR